MRIYNWLPQWHFHFHDNTVIPMKLNELAVQLGDLATQLDKATGEILAKISDLETALENTELPSEALAAIEALKVKAQALDDVVPDFVPTE